MARCLMCDEFDAVACGPYQAGDECLCARCLEDADYCLEQYGKRLERMAENICTPPPGKSQVAEVAAALAQRDLAAAVSAQELAASVNAVSHMVRRVGLGVLTLLVYVAMRLVGLVS